MSHEGHTGLSDQGDKETRSLACFCQKKMCEAQQPPEVIKSVSGAWLTHGVLIPEASRGWLSIHRTQLLSGHCSSQDLLLPYPSGSTRLTSPPPEFIQEAMPHASNLAGGFSAVLSG